MAKIDNDKASAAIIHATAIQFLAGKEGVSRKFIKEALGAGLIDAQQVSRITGVQERMVHKAILQTLSNKQLKPVVELIRTRAQIRFQELRPQAV